MKTKTETIQIRITPLDRRRLEKLVKPPFDNMSAVVRWLILKESEKQHEEER